MKLSFFFALMGSLLAIGFTLMFRIEHPVDFFALLCVGVMAALFGGQLGSWLGQKLSGVRVEAVCLGFMMAFASTSLALNGYEHWRFDHPHYSQQLHRNHVSSLGPPSFLDQAGTSGTKHAGGFSRHWHDAVVETKRRWADLTRKQQST
jgi:hypothetical protein